MDTVDLLSIATPDYDEVVAWLRASDQDNAPGILADAEALAQKAAQILFEAVKGNRDVDQGNLMGAMLLGALKARFKHFGVSEEGSSLACVHALAAFARAIEMIEAGAEPGVRH